MGKAEAEDRAVSLDVFFNEQGWIGVGKCRRRIPSPINGAAIWRAAGRTCGSPPCVDKKLVAAIGPNNKTNRLLHDLLISFGGTLLRPSNQSIRSCTDFGWGRFIETCSYRDERCARTRPATPNDRIPKNAPDLDGMASLRFRPLCWRMIDLCASAPHPSTTRRRLLTLYFPS
jgi:hypothetical protein